MTSYRLTDAALADLDRLYEFGILNFGLVQADSYFDGLVDYFQVIAENPLSYVTVNEIRSGYRRAIYQSNSIYYYLENTVVVIVRILGRQNVYQVF